MAIVTRRYLESGPTVGELLQHVSPSSAVVERFEQPVCDVSYDNAVPGLLETLDEYMASLGYQPEILGNIKYDILERVGDPIALAGRVRMYSKLVAGVTQLFARASDGSVSQITPATSAVLIWGADSILAGNDTRFLAPGHSNGGAATANIYQFASPRAGTLRRLYVHHNTAVGNGNSVQYTLLINGVATAITCTLATGAIGTASDLANTAAVAAGDLISFRAVKALAIGNGGLDVQGSVELAS